MAEVAPGGAVSGSGDGRGDGDVVGEEFEASGGFLLGGNHRSPTSPRVRRRDGHRGSRHRNRLKPLLNSNTEFENYKNEKIKGNGENVGNPKNNVWG